MLHVRLTKRLKGFTLRVELDVEQDFVMLTGPNGAGKTTLLKMIAGLVRADQGVVVLHGKTLQDEHTFLNPEQRNVGFVFQKPALFPWLTVEENILFPLKRRERERLSHHIEFLTTELELTHLLQNHPDKLSGGEAQRVALARALVKKPDILLLDEPLSAVDKLLRPKLRKFLKDIQKLWEIPVIMVSHDYAEIHYLGDRVFELDEGSLNERKKKDNIVFMPLVSY